jgi:hypothetical protein
MPDTIRDQILVAIAAKLADPDYGMAKVSAIQPSALDMAQWADPQCFVWADNELPRIGETPDFAINIEAWNMPISVEVWGKGDPEEYAGQVHKAMRADVTWGALALETRRVNIALLNYDPNRRTRGVLCSYVVYYRHAQRNPYTGI